jgi:hypothetical protein
MTIAPRLRSAAVLAAIAPVTLLVLFVRGERFGLDAARLAVRPTAPPPTLVTPEPVVIPTAPPAVAPPAAAPAAAPTSAGAFQRCQPAQLVLSEGRAGAAAGNIGAVFILTDRSNVACYLYGFPGMQLLDAQGRPPPTRVLRTAGRRSPKSLRVAWTSPLVARRRSAPAGATWGTRAGPARPARASR